MLVFLSKDKYIKYKRGYICIYIFTAIIISLLILFMTKMIFTTHKKICCNNSKGIKIEISR